MRNTLLRKAKEIQTSNEKLSNDMTHALIDSRSMKILNDGKEERNKLEIPH